MTELTAQQLIDKARADFVREIRNDEHWEFLRFLHDMRPPMNMEQPYRYWTELLRKYHERFTGSAASAPGTAPGGSAGPHGGSETAP